MKDPRLLICPKNTCLERNKHLWKQELANKHTIHAEITSRVFTHETQGSSMRFLRDFISAGLLSEATRYTHRISVVLKPARSRFPPQ